MNTNEEIKVAHSEALDRGGALVVAEEIARVVGSELFVGFENPRVVADDIQSTELFQSHLKRELSHRSSTIRDLCFFFDWQNVPELHEADILIESGNNPAWYVPGDDQSIIRYVHSPPYAAYHRFHDVGTNIIKKVYATALRTLYLQTIPYPDIWIANSELVARRIEKYWGIEDVRVVYPPIETSNYYISKDSDYFFTLSHLRGEKRIDEIVSAFEGIEETLLVGGDGPAKADLEKEAPKNVQFLGWLTEKEKREHLSKARAFVFNADSEDFGIAPAEALASGTPVIGVRDGYTKIQIQDGKNGLLYSRGVKELRDSIVSFDISLLNWGPEEIAADAERYAKSRFRREIIQAVEDASDERASLLGPSNP
ncbi:glycosyltransferase [Halorubellus sp. PRR65]|uniref:glycosyltransferase n=1 Tax=Halorubellus sp. PRR65 TaxID=3098148 RepID=UPI002B258C4F|nr:glycosyltransferase [Halorubellus sp. PRR65]